MRDYKIGDFDIDISDVLLVHRFRFEKGHSMTDNSSGRVLSGIVFCISGGAELDFFDEKLTLSSGQMIYLPAGIAYTVKSNTEQFHHITANFTERTLKEPSLTMFSGISRGRIRFVSPLKNSSYYKELFERLVSVWQGKNHGYSVLAKSIIYEILFTYFTDANSFICKNDAYSRILPAKSYLDSNYTENTSVSELALSCGLSETHFRRLFVKLFGLSPTDYRLTKRILKAKDYLMSGEKTIMETAVMVGFEDPNYFGRVFKKHTGMTPGQVARSGASKNNTYKPQEN